MVSDRETCARLLGRAFSRYNGLTNSAKLGLITNLIADNDGGNEGSLFGDRPFLYAHEVRAEFEKENIKARSAEVLLQHAISFGFLYRAMSGVKRTHPKLATKVESRSHIALSPLGRAMRSSRNLGEESEKFKLFLWEYALLERDFDMYGLIIKMTEEKRGALVSMDVFFEKFNDIRKQQIEWMKEKISNRFRREKIQHHISWIGEKVKIGKKYKRQFKLDTFLELSSTSQGHHYGQRIRWAKHFKHIENRELTGAGHFLAKNLPETKQTDEHPFFWLGPPKECIRTSFLASAKVPVAHSEPAWNLLRPSLSSNEPSDEFVKKVAKYMIDSFESTRMTNFNQSSLDAVVPYIYFLECQRKERVEEQVVFRRVLDRNKEKFVCTLRANLAKSHYHLR